MKRISKILLIMMLILIAPITVACKNDRVSGTGSKYGLTINVENLENSEGLFELKGATNSELQNFYVAEIDGEAMVYISSGNIDITKNIESGSLVNLTFYFSPMSYEIEFKVDDENKEFVLEEDTDYNYFSYSFEIERNTTISISGILYMFEM